MAISLSFIDIDSINQTIQKEHESWVKNAPSYVDIAEIKISNIVFLITLICGLEHVF